MLLSLRSRFTVGSRRIKLIIDTLGRYFYRFIFDVGDLKSLNLPKGPSVYLYSTDRRTDSNCRSRHRSHGAESSLSRTKNTVKKIYGIV